MWPPSNANLSDINLEATGVLLNVEDCSIMAEEYEVMILCMENHCYVPLDVREREVEQEEREGEEEEEEEADKGEGERQQEKELAEGLEEQEIEQADVRSHRPVEELNFCDSCTGSGQRCTRECIQSPLCLSVLPSEERDIQQHTQQSETIGQKRQRTVSSEERKTTEVSQKNTITQRERGVRQGGGSHDSSDQVPGSCRKRKLTSGTVIIV